MGFETLEAGKKRRPRLKDLDGAIALPLWWSKSTVGGGYVLVYRPEYPTATKRGYVRRSYLIWEAHHGPIPKGMVIHHKDGNSENDEIQNLEMLSQGDHVRVHRLGRGMTWLVKWRMEHEKRPDQCQRIG